MMKFIQPSADVAGEVGGGPLSKRGGLAGGLRESYSGGSLLDELGCFLRVGHVGHMARLYLDRLSLGALRHHPLLVRIDRPNFGGDHVPGGLVLPGGVLDRVSERIGDIGTCDIAMNSAFSFGMSAAKSAAKSFCFIHQLPLLSGANAFEAWGNPCSIVAQLSPSSSAKAAM